jgi:hypothetical protein
MILKKFDFSASFFDYDKDQYITIHPYGHLINFLMKLFNYDVESSKKCPTI